MKSPEIWIEHTEAKGKQIAGLHTKIYLLREDDAGHEERIDISSSVRAVDVQLHAGEPITAKLECFITGIAGRANVETLILNELKRPMKRWWRRDRDAHIEVTSLGSQGWKQYIPGLR
jgi:hypothetical protein